MAFDESSGQRALMIESARLVLNLGALRGYQCLNKDSSDSELGIAMCRTNKE